MISDNNNQVHSRDQMKTGQEKSMARVDTIRAITIMVGVLTGLISLGFTWMAITQPAWQYMVMALLYTATMLYALVCYVTFLPKENTYPVVVGLSVFFGITLAASSALLEGIGIPVAIVYLVYALIISSAVYGDRRANTAVLSGLVIASISSLLTEFSPFEQISSSLVNAVTPAFLGVLAMIYIVLLSMQFVAATMRIRLVTSFIAIVIIPLSILSFIQSRFTFTVLSQENNRSLHLAAQQTAQTLDSYLNQIQTNLVEASKIDVYERYLALPEETREGSAEERELRLALSVLDSVLSSNYSYLASYALLDINGINVYDSLSDRVSAQYTADALRSMTIPLDTVTKGKGSDESLEDYFLIASRTGIDYASPLQVTGRNQSLLISSSPVKNAGGEIIGVLRVRYDGLILQNMLRQNNGLLGAKSYTMLIDENGIRLADTFTPNFLYRTVSPLPLSQLNILQENKRLPIVPESMITTDYPEFSEILKRSAQQPFFTTELSSTAAGNDLPEVGAIWKLQSRPWNVVYLFENFDNAALRQSQRQLSVLVTILIAGFVGVIAVFTSQLLSSPITQLTTTAQKISSGDLDARTNINSADEFGMLGNAFNMMTSQLKTLIGELEGRVKSRTQEIEGQNEALSVRARQLQTLADVARQIVSVQELETLLSSVATLVSERFGFYHVGIFLLDENKEYAILRAANSEGGKRMLDRKHTLPVGRVGIVGFVTGAGLPRIATDVGEDAVFFNNPDLPDTRSEMALPLFVGGQIIGAIDIQSTQSNAFHPDDIELFNTLADQVAIAIYNNQLYTETLRALDEAQSLHRQYLNNEWSNELAIRRVRGYLYNRAGIVPQDAELPEWKSVIHSGKAAMEHLAGSETTPDRAMMVMPIIVRGETIGVIHVQDQGEDRNWTEDEITVVNDVANQVAVALENARLFETTVRRADREKKVLDITARIRSSNDPERMMQVAVDEIQRALGASRTQIYIRRNEQQNAAGDGTPEQTNGKNGHH